jgi:hypothetical protein
LIRSADLLGVSIHCIGGKIQTIYSFNLRNSLNKNDNSDQGKKNMGKIIFSKKPIQTGKIQFFLVVVSGDTVDMVELLGLLLGWTDWN